MKFDKILALATIAIAVAAAGCRYNKAATDGSEEADAVAVADRSEDTASATDLDTEADGAPAIAAVEDADTGKIVTDRPFTDYCKPVAGADFAPVYFGFDSSAVPSAEFAKIDAVAKDLLANAKHVVVVEGNCDERGSNEYNLSLGENRANIVRDQLVNLGVSSERVQTKSYGEEKPAVQGSGESVWSKNRRAEFLVLEF